MKRYILFFTGLIVIVLLQNCSQSKPFTFVQLSDPQMGFISNNMDVEAERELYTEAVEYINRTKPAFVVITGDFVNSRTNITQINAFKEITSLIDKKIPVYLVPGNHDIGLSPTEEQFNFYMNHYGYDRFSFNYGGVCFVGLNSCFIKSDMSQEKDQLTWLKDIFSKNKSKRKVIFIHHSFFIENIDEEDTYFNLPTEKRKDYFRLFKENNTKVIFAGHYHDNASATYDGIDMITTSSVGKQLGNTKPGFREVTVYRNSITNKYVEIKLRKHMFLTQKQTGMTSCKSSLPEPKRQYLPSKLSFN